MALDAEWCYADCHLCWVAFMLSVTSSLYMLSAVMLNVVMLSVLMQNVVAPEAPRHLIENYLADRHYGGYM